MSGLTLQQIAHALGGDVHGDHVLAPGPHHSAIDRSLSVKLTPDDDFVVNSFAGDDWASCRDYVKQKVGIPLGNEHARPDYDPLASMEARHGAKTNGNGKPGYMCTAVYPYTDADGQLLYEVLRYEHPTEAKTFRQRRPDGNGGRLSGAGDRKVVGPCCLRALSTVSATG